MTRLRTSVLVKTRAEAGGVERVTRTLPELEPDDALVEIRYAGICGTDLHIIEWNDWASRTYLPPFALGHEFAGRVSAVGSAVRNFEVGDRVVAETHLSCGSCRQCRTGLSHLCGKLKVFSRLDRGAFAERTVVPATLLRRVPDGVPDHVACVMEPLGIAVRAVADFMAGGSSIFVSGCGPIGLFTIAVARALGAMSIAASDPVRERRDLALRLGASTVIDPMTEPVADQVLQVTGGARLSVETSGAAVAIREALAATAKAGALVLVGLPDTEVPLNLTRDVILREVRIAGLYGRRLDETWVQVEDLLSSGQLDVEPILTGAYHLNDFESAFAAARSGGAGKVIFDLAGPCAPGPISAD